MFCLEQQESVVLTTSHPQDTSGNPWIAVTVISAAQAPFDMSRFDLALFAYDLNASAIKSVMFIDKNHHRCHCL